MALLSTEVLPDNTLEEFRIEFNKLITDVTGLSLGNTFDTQIIFEGTTDDTFETALSVTDPTADRSIVFPNQSGNVILDSANISLADNIELQFGTGTDLKIFHDSNNSIIRDSGTGALFLEGSVVAIRNAASDETMAQFTQDGAAQLYHNNVAILATAATGISVAGDVVATDDLILDSDAAVIQLGDDQEVTLTHVHNTGVLLNAAMVVQFRDSAINIGSPADGDLDINADDEIELNSTLIDINGAVQMSSTALVTGVLTTTAATVFNGGFASNADSTMGTNKKIIFRDAAIHISSTADGDLAIAADDEIDLTSTLIDVNGNLDVSGTYTGAGVMTTGGNIVIPDGGNIGSASDTNAMSISSIGLVSLSATNAIKLNVGTTAQRPTGAAGLIRYNSTTGGFEGYGAAWGALGGGATGGGGDTVFVENQDDVTTDYSITAGSNALSVGPIIVETGVTVTVPTGQRWLIL